MDCFLIPKSIRQSGAVGMTGKTIYQAVTKEKALEPLERAQKNGALSI